MASESLLDRRDTLTPGDISKRCDTIINHFQTSYPRFDLEYFRNKGMYSNNLIDQDLILMENIKKSFIQKIVLALNQIRKKWLTQKKEVKL